MLPILIALAFVGVLALFFWLLVKYVGGADITFWDALCVMVMARLVSGWVKTAASGLGSYESLAVSLVVYVFGVALYLSHRHGVPVWRGVFISSIFSVATIIGGVVLVTSGILPVPTSAPSSAATPKASPAP